MNLPKVSEYLDELDREDRELGRTLYALDKEMLRRVVDAQEMSLDFEFLGFTSVYRHLAHIVPLHFTIVDLGCNAACQSYYFRKHKGYIGIDRLALDARFRLPGHEHLVADAKDWVKDQADRSRYYPMFAISSYVPDEELNLLIRAKFQDLFVFYPKSRMDTRERT